MPKALITEANLQNIANAIRTKLGVETAYKPGEMAEAIGSISGYPEPAGIINIGQNGTANVKDYASANVQVPNSYAAGDEGKVVHEGALVSQASGTATQNGTVDTTLINSLLVNVSGGGGSDIDLTYLPNSTAADVLASSDYSMYTAGSSAFGRFAINIRLYALTVQASVDANGLLLPENVTLECYLGSPNQSCTVYLAGKKKDGTNEHLFLGIPYSLTNGNDPHFDAYNGAIIYSTFGAGYGTQVNVSPFDEHVYAIALDAVNRRADYYLDGEFLGSKIYGNSGNRVLIGDGGIDTTSAYQYVGNYYVKYAGVVNAYENSATIIANQQTIMTKLGMSI